jgi:hypothetical protein
MTNELSPPFVTQKRLFKLQILPQSIKIIFLGKFQLEGIS